MFILVKYIIRIRAISECSLRNICPPLPSQIYVSILIQIYGILFTSINLILLLHPIDQFKMWFTIKRLEISHV